MFSNEYSVTRPEPAAPNTVRTDKQKPRLMRDHCAAVSVGLASIVDLLRKWLISLGMAIMYEEHSFYYHALLSMVDGDDENHFFRQKNAFDA
jgi:hypothetical protein